jgi:uncharacterized protein DUF2510
MPDSVQPPENLPPAGWHPDPQDPMSQRYWDGHQWTDHRAPISSAPRTSAVSTGAMVIGAGVVAALIGAFGPWATAGVFSRSGVDGDGVITAVVAGVLAIALVLSLRQPTRGLSTGAILAGLVIGIVGVVDIIDVNNKISDAGAFAQAVVHIGWGLYLTAGAGLVILIGGVALRNELNSSA